MLARPFMCQLDKDKLDLVRYCLALAERKGRAVIHQRLWGVWSIVVGGRLPRFKSCGCKNPLCSDGDKVTFAEWGGEREGGRLLQQNCLPFVQQQILFGVSNSRLRALALQVAFAKCCEFATGCAHSCKKERQSCCC